MPEPGEASPAKLCVIIVSSVDADRLISVLVDKEIAATKVASSGGFLRRGNATIFTGVTADRVDEVLEVVRTECRARRELMPLEALPFDAGGPISVAPVEVRVGGAIVFVLDVARFERV